MQTLGGEALADTKWTILTSAGDVVKENAGALPTHILSPGSYAVVADHGGLSYTRKFSIEPVEIPSRSRSWSTTARPRRRI